MIGQKVFDSVKLRTQKPWGNARCFKAIVAYMDRGIQFFGDNRSALSSKIAFKVRRIFETLIEAN